MNKLFFIHLVLVSFLLSQNQNVMIDEIEVRGNEMISDYNIKFISKLESGTIINNYHIQNAIERLWSTGRYLDIKIDIEKIIVNRLVISVLEAPPIKDIVILGNDKISDKKLLDELSLTSNNFVNYNDIQQSVNKLTSYYKEKNYHNVEVAFSIEDFFLEGQRFSNIVFNIQEGNKIKLKNINIIGNQNYSDRKILKQLKFYQKRRA